MSTEVRDKSGRMSEASDLCSEQNCMSEQKIRTENGIEAAQFDSKTTIKRARWESFQIAPCPETGKINVCNQSHAEEEQADHTYTVTVEDSIPTHCTCKSYEFNTGHCKHCVAVLADSNAMNVAEHGHSDKNTPTAEASESNEIRADGAGVTTSKAKHISYCPHCDVETTCDYNYRTGRSECPNCGGGVE